MTRPVRTTPYGSLLKTRREARGLSQEALAEKADTASAVVSNLERGMRNPSREMARRLAVGYAPVDADAACIKDLVDEALNAAGFTPDTGQIIPVGPQERALIERYRQLPERERKIVDLVLSGNDAPAPSAPPLREREPALEPREQRPKTRHF